MNTLKNRLTYDEVSPITGNLCVLIDVDEAVTGLVSKLCMESGYTTNTLLVDKPEVYESLKTHFLTGFQFAKAVDGAVWIPSAQASPFAALYPVAGENEGELIWHVTPTLPDRGDEIELDYDATKRFKALDYSSAFDLFAALSNLQTEEE